MATLSDRTINDTVAPPDINTLLQGVPTWIGGTDGRTYAKDEIINYGGALFVSLQNNNKNKNPITEKLWWSGLLMSDLIWEQPFVYQGSGANAWYDDGLGTWFARMGNTVFCMVQARTASTNQGHNSIIFIINDNKYLPISSQALQPAFGQQMPTNITAVGECQMWGYGTGADEGKCYLKNPYGVNGNVGMYRCHANFIYKAYTP